MNTCFIFTLFNSFFLYDQFQHPRTFNLIDLSQLHDNLQLLVITNFNLISLAIHIHKLKPLRPLPESLLDHLPNPLHPHLPDHPIDMNLPLEAYLDHNSNKINYITNSKSMKCNITAPSSQEYE